MEKAIKDMSQKELETVMDQKDVDEIKKSVLREMYDKALRK